MFASKMHKSLSMRHDSGAVFVHTANRDTIHANDTVQQQRHQTMFNGKLQSIFRCYLVLVRCGINVYLRTIFADKVQCTSIGYPFSVCVLTILCTKVKHSSYTECIQHSEPSTFSGACMKCIHTPHSSSIQPLR